MPFVLHLHTHKHKHELLDSVPRYCTIPARWSNT